MHHAPHQAAIYRLADLSRRAPTAFDLRPGPETAAEIAAALDLSDLRKLSLRGEMRAAGRDDWVLEAVLGATVTQPCVVTLAPVTTRIDTPVIRRFVADWHEPGAGSEVEMPADDTAEPLRDPVDLGEILTEALALALPTYPRAENAELGEARFAPPGRAPLDDEETRPFAALAALRNKPGERE